MCKIVIFFYFALIDANALNAHLAQVIFIYLFDLKNKLDKTTMTLKKIIIIKVVLKLNKLNIRPGNITNFPPKVWKQIGQITTRFTTILILLEYV